MSHSTEPYQGFGLCTPDSTQPSERGHAPFDYTPECARSRPASEALVGLLNPRPGGSQNLSFGPELRLSPGFEPNDRSAKPQYSEGAAQHQRTPFTLPQDVLQQSFLVGGSIVDSSHLMRRTNEFHWDTNDASLHYQAFQQPIHDADGVVFSPIIPSAPNFGGSTQLQHDLQRASYPTNLSHQSWDLLQSIEVPSSLRGAEDFLMVPTREQSNYTHSYSNNPTFPSYPARSTPETASFPDYLGALGTQVNTALIFGSQHLVPSSNDLGSVYSAPKSRTKRKRGRLSPIRRAKAKAQRKIGNCVRCRIMKADCDDGNPCGRCKSVVGKARTYHELCYREDLGDATLVRRGNSEFDQEIMSFRSYRWKATTETPRVLRLRWWLPTSSSSKLPTFTIECQEFAKSHDDIVDAIWQHQGCVKKIRLPHYACRDTKKLLNSVSGFLDAGRPAIEKHLVDENADDLERITLQEAYRYAARYGSKILRLALRVRSTTVLSAGSGTLEGYETLGIQAVDGAAAGYVGDRPLPPAIDHQIDVAIWEILRKDHDTLMSELKRVLFGTRKQQVWFEIFLAFFIALANVQYVHGQAIGWMKSQLETDSAVKVSYLVRKMIAHWNYSAENVLHHFRSIFRGELPLALADRDLDELVQRERLDTESTAYVRHVLRIIKDQDGSFLRPRTVAAEANLPEVTELGDHWIRRLFRDQYIAPQK